MQRRALGNAESCLLMRVALITEQMCGRGESQLQEEPFGAELAKMGTLLAWLFWDISGCRCAVWSPVLGENSFTFIS